jgi:chemotaxis signal transduction protein
MEDFRPLQIKHYLVFEVAKKKFAIDILDVDSIHTSSGDGSDDMDDLRAAVRLHKHVVPIINLRKKLNLHCEERPLLASLIFLKNRQKSSTSIVGLKVDQTLEIVEIYVAKDPNGRQPRLIKAMIGLTNEVVSVLNISDIVKEEEPHLLHVEAMN